MNNDKSIFMLLVINVFNLSLLTIGQYYSITWLVLVALVCFCFIFILADIKLVFPLLLFYLPWLPLLKFSGASSSGSSYFTIITIIIIIRLAFKIKKDVNINLFLIAIFFIAFVFIVRYARMVPLQTNFLHFFLSFILMTLLLADRKNYSDFRVCAIYYSIGLLLSCFASYLVFSSPNMQLLIKLQTAYLIGDIMTLRQSGFTMDPNFFSSQILMAIACLMILFKDSKSLFYMFLYVVLLGTFLYFGFTSLSKMFLFSIVIMIIVWVISIFISKKKLSYKIGFLFLLVLLIIVISKSQLFLSLFNGYAMRLADANNLETLTTGRSSDQLIYINYILNNLGTLIFGQGFSYKILALAEGNMHNTFIEILYEAGIIGTFLLGAWYMAINNLSTTKNIKMSWENKLLFYIFLLGYFLPWVALDVVFFHQFFFFLILLVYLKKYLFSKYTGEAIDNGFENELKY